MLEVEVVELVTKMALVDKMEAQEVVVLVEMQERVPL
tara:strand:+ start:261 stop:371 length:111 start_codon:yes stop_codon:yes gene_type:complete